MFQHPIRNQRESEVRSKQEWSQKEKKRELDLGMSMGDMCVLYMTKCTLSKKPLQNPASKEAIKSHVVLTKQPKSFPSSWGGQTRA